MNRRFDRSVRRVIGVGFAIAVSLPLVLGTAPIAKAATGKWYRLPSYNGVEASAYLSYLNSGYGSGEAGGQIWVRNNTGKGKYYVKFKPDPRGPGYRRGTQNVISGAHYFGWYDKFWAYTTGYRFKLCKVRTWTWDPCGHSLLIEAIY